MSLTLPIICWDGFLPNQSLLLPTSLSTPRVTAIHAQKNMRIALALRSLIWPFSDELNWPIRTPGLTPRNRVG